MPDRVYIFRCPLCAKTYRSEEPGEPCCTGPSESRDDHELTLMHLLRVDAIEIHPARAAVRAAGPLILAAR